MIKTIYILRHFKVNDSVTHKLDAKQFSKWVDEYDIFPLEYIDVELPKVEKVYVSSQKRAQNSAKYLKLDFETTELLQEVEAYPFFETKLKFSKNFWLVFGRLLWFFNFTQKETRKETIKRAEKFVEEIQQQKYNSCLIISHGLFLKVLVKVLTKIGYTHEVDINIKSGKIYKLSFLDKEVGVK